MNAVFPWVRYGWGVDADLSQALRWLRAGAGGYYGDPLAQFEIGRMYALQPPLDHVIVAMFLLSTMSEGLVGVAPFQVVLQEGHAPQLRRSIQVADLVRPPRICARTVLSGCNVLVRDSTCRGTGDGTGIGVG
jgi:hypothetical protein